MTVASTTRESRGYVDGPDGLVHYRRQGAGDPLLLLHQTPSSSEQFVPSLPLFARERLAIAVDTPGFGMSTAPAAAPGSVGHYVESFVAVLDALGIDKVDVLGHHTGATLAVELAAAHPDRVGRLVLFGLLAIRDEQERSRWRDALLVKYELDPGLGFLDAYVRGKVIAVVDDGDGAQAQRELTATVQAGPTYWWAYDAVLAHDTLARLAEVRADVLFLNADGEDPDMADSMRHAASTVPHAWSQVAGTPSRNFREPTDYVRAALEFLDGADGRPPVGR